MYIPWFDKLRCGCENNCSYIYICSVTVGCQLQRSWTARYIDNGGMTKYALSEDMELIDWILMAIFFSLSILYYWHENCKIFECFYFTPSPQLQAGLHGREVQSNRVDRLEGSTARKVCKCIKLWQLQSLLIECSTF